MKKLKLFFALFAMLALGVGNALAETVTFTPTNCTSWTSSQAEQTQTIDGITLHSTGAANNTQLRLYSGATHTFTSTVGNITSILFTCTVNGTNNYGPGKMTGDGYVASTGKTGEWTGNSATVKLTGGQSRCTSIVVTYTPSTGGGETPDPTTYTIKWHTDKGVTTDVTSNEGATITKPATDPTMTGYEFMGWTDQCDVAADGTGFTPLTNFGTADSDKDFYAVFAEATTTSGGGSSNYEKVTSNLADWAGDYLIAYNNTTFADGRTGGTNGMGAQNKKVDLSSKISNNAIPASVGDQYNVTLEAVSGGYVLKTKDGNYNYQSNNANGLATTKTIATAASYAINVTFTSENDIKLALTGSAAGAVFRYNTQGYFRFYKNGGQSAVYLYKKTSGGGSTTTYSNYITTCSGSTPVENLTGAQFAWSAATAEATMGASNTFPTLTNTLPVSVTYESSTPATATIAADGTITLVAPGTTTISAKFAGGEVSSTTYAPKTVLYTLTVKKAPLDPIAGGVIDILNQAWTGKTNSTYGDVAEKTAENTGHSNAKYVAQCAGDKSSIQLRSNNSNSGVVSTISGGVVKRIEVEWHADTDAARTLQIYGSNTAYTAATDLYGDAKGELLGELNKGEGETTLDFSEWTGDYKYIGFRSKSGAMYLTTVTITWLPTISKVTIDDQIENGSVSVSGAADLNSVAAGTELTLSNTPATGYKLTAYDVYKTSDNTTKVIVTDGKFIMPEFDVTISATFEAAKTLTGIEITNAATQITFWQTETFNHNGLKVTAHFNGAEDEDVTSKITVTGSTATASNQTVTVSYTEGTVTKSTSYEITVKAIPNTKETAYSVADAYGIIDKLTTATGVFITGTISQVDSYNSTYKSITYWISADGTTTNQLQVYSGKGLESADFAAVTDLTVGDKVIVCGDLKKYNSTYEFDKNNYLAEYTPTTKDPAGLEYATTSYTANVGEAFATPTLTNPNNLTVTYSTSDAAKATVDASTGAVTIVAVGKVTITASTTGDATHDAGAASYTITISDPALAIATLPFTYNSGKAAIETTAGITHSGLGSDYTAAGVPPLKFDTEGDNVIVHYDQQAGEFSFVLKQNGQTAGTFTVYESANGEDYTPVWTGGDLGNAKSETITPTLAAASRYVKFEYTTKPSGTNYGLGSISIQKPDFRQEASLTWSVGSVTLNQGDNANVPTLSNPNGLTLTSCTTTNDAVATVSPEGVITLVGAIGTTTITATFEGNEDYKPAEVSCTITVVKEQIPTGTFALYTGEIVEGDYVIVSDNFAMNTTSSAAPRLQYQEVTPAENKLVNPANQIVWHVAANGEYWTLYNDYDEVYAVSTGVKNQATTAKEVTDKAKWSISGTETYDMANLDRENGSDPDNKYLRKNSDVGFACYKDATGGQLTLYRKQTPHIVTVAACTNGSVSASGVIDTKALSGDIITVSNTPEFDYQFVGYNVYKTGDETTVITVTNGTFTMPAFDVTISATFEAIQETTITLSGKFSTGEYEYAEFATGNLQHNPKSGDWRFAKQQYQYVGKDNIYVGKEDYKGWIDLFGWSADDKFGVNPSNDNTNYQGEFVDWGTLFPEEGWSTLSKNQWYYLLNQRTKAASLKQIAMVGETLGIMLFPDEWTLPDDCEPTQQTHHDEEDGEDHSCDFVSYNYTLAQWTELEKAGAIFLPAAGRRTGGWGNETISPHMIGKAELDADNHYKHYADYYAYYWTSTKTDGKVNYLINCTLVDKVKDTYTVHEGHVNWAEEARYGQSVRLAKVTVTPEVIRDGLTVGQWGTLCPTQNVENPTGATFYQIAYLEEKDGLPFNMHFNEVAGTLQAGQPYFFIASATEIKGVKYGAVMTEGSNANGFYGYIGAEAWTLPYQASFDATSDKNTFVIWDNSVFRINEETKIKSERCYININSTEPSRREPTPALVGARRITMGVSGINGQNTATGMENVEASAQPVKTIINGQLFILRGEKMYDAQGKLVK